MEIITKPWGYEQIWAHSDKYVGKILVINSGKKLSRQYHVKKDETIYVLNGTLTLEIGEGNSLESMDLNKGDTYHVEPKTIHRFCNSTEEELRLIEVSTTELDDVVRLEDDYGRSYA